jgi:hypothetical protein
LNEEEEERISKILKGEKTTIKIAIPEQYKDIVENLEFALEQFQGIVEDLENK